MGHHPPPRPLRDALLNYATLSAKLTATDIQAVIAEYDQFPHDETVILVRDALHLSAHIVTTRPDQLPNQLAGRLWFHRHKAEIALLYADAMAKSVWKWGENLPNPPLESAKCGLKHILVHPAWIRHIADSPDKTEIATSATDSVIRIWDAKTGTLLRQWQTNHDAINALAWGGLGMLIATSGSGNTAQVWDAWTGDLICHINHKFYGLQNVTLDKDGQYLITAAIGSADIWDVTTGEKISYIGSDYTMMKALCWDDTYSQLAVSGSNYRVYIWDIQANKVTRILNLQLKPLGNKGNNNGTATSLAWDKTGRYLATGTTNEVVYIWDTHTGELCHTLIGHIGWIVSVAFDMTGNFIASVARDNVVRVWDIKTGEAIRTLGGFSALVFVLRWDADGLFLSTNGTKKVRIWDLSEHIPIESRPTHADTIYGLAWNTNGKYLATGSLDRTVKIWDVTTGEAIRIFKGYKQMVWGVAWNGAGSHLATVSWDKKVTIWDVQKRKKVKTFKAHTNSLLGVAWDEGSDRIVTISSDKTAQIWDVNTGDSLHVLAGHEGGIYAVAWHHNLIATGAVDKTIRLWNAQTGENTHILTGHDAKIYGLAWDKTGRYLASGGDDNHAHIWDMTTGEISRTITVKGNSVLGISWHPNGTYLATGSDDVCVWDIQTGECVATFTFDTINSRVAWSPDGTQLAIACIDGRVLWLNWDK